MIRRWNAPKWTDEQWNNLAMDTEYLFSYAHKIGLKLSWFGSHPIVSQNSIAFVGTGKDNCIFSFIRHSSKFPSCDTGGHAYDLAVVAVLELAKMHNPEFEWMSNGDVDDLADGKAIAVAIGIKNQQENGLADDNEWLSNDSTANMLQLSQSMRSITDALAMLPAIQNPAIVGNAMAFLPPDLMTETASVMRDLTFALENMNNLAKRIEMHSNTLLH